MFINAILLISFLINTIKCSSILCLEKTGISKATATAFTNRNPCIKCKWFITNPNSNEKNQGLCKKFKKFNKKTNSVKAFNNIYEYAKDCRRNNFQCGTNAYYFEPKSENENENENENDSITEKYLNNDSNEELVTLEAQIKEMEELNCGEVNEKRDLEDWETEYNSIKKRIEKLLRIKDKKQ
jgi:hypothetical protein